jgi:heme-degrading monooxygenase HmoA
VSEGAVVAVIFTSRLSENTAGYSEAADQMEALAAQQPGYVDFVSARDGNGLGISISYWVDEASAVAWKHNVEHLAVQSEGRRRWYDLYRVQIATVSRSYEWSRPPAAP